MIIRVLSLFIIPAMITLAGPVQTKAQSFTDAAEETNRRAPVIIQPKLTEQGQEKLDGGFFSGIGRIFRPKQDVEVQSATSSRRNTGESYDEYTTRYMQERAQRLSKRTERNDPENFSPDNNPYQLTLPGSYNPLTHYQGRDGQVYERQTPVDPAILSKVRASAEAYAKKHGTDVQTLMQNPKFEKQIEALYVKTAKETRQAEIRSAQQAAARKKAEAAARAKAQQEAEKQQKELEREQAREQ